MAEEKKLKPILDEELEKVNGGTNITYLEKVSDGTEMTYLVLYECEKCKYVWRMEQESIPNDNDTTTCPRCQRFIKPRILEWIPYIAKSFPSKRR